MHIEMLVHNFPCKIWNLSNTNHIQVTQYTERGQAADEMSAVGTYFKFAVQQALVMSAMQAFGERVVKGRSEQATCSLCSYGNCKGLYWRIQTNNRFRPTGSTKGNRNNDRTGEHIYTVITNNEQVREIDTSGLGMLFFYKDLFLLT